VPLDFAWTEIDCSLKYFNTWNCIHFPQFYGREKGGFYARCITGGRAAGGRCVARDAGGEGLWLDRGL
jgi:hypothetical protein